MTDTDNHALEPVPAPAVAPVPEPTSAPPPQPTAHAKPPAVDTIVFPDEPLLLRMDKATYAFYKILTDETDKKMLEIVTHTANVSPILRQASKKDFKKYKNPEYPTVTSSIIDKYAERQKVLMSSGTLDLVWGVKWLLSYVVLIDHPVQNADTLDAMISVTQRWLEALAEAGIVEVNEVLPQLIEVLGTARQELPVGKRLSMLLPGSFNTACSMVFAGELKRIHVNNFLPNWVVNKPEIARANGIVNVEDQAEAVSQDALQTIGGIVARDSVSVSTAPVDLRIMASDDDDCKITVTDAEGDYCLVKVSEFDRGTMKDTGRPFELRWERAVAANLRPGFIIEATLHRLSDGTRYIDQVTMVWPTYTPLNYVDMAQF